jgi:hypothetical protein
MGEPTLPLQQVKAPAQEAGALGAKGGVLSVGKD